MRFQILLIFVIISIKSFGQNAPNGNTGVKFQRVDSIAKFIDSLRAKMISDTSKFDKTNIMLTPNGKVNRYSYSPLFFINILYKYKLDIVDANDVIAFLNEILITDKIESITLLNETKSLEIFGIHGMNGTIIIQMKDISKIKLSLAGFKPNKAVGDNFH